MEEQSFEGKAVLWLLKYYSTDLKKQWEEQVALDRGERLTVFKVLLEVGMCVRA